MLITKGEGGKKSNNWEKALTSLLQKCKKRADQLTKQNKTEQRLMGAREDREVLLKSHNL